LLIPDVKSFITLGIGYPTGTYFHSLFTVVASSALPTALQCLLVQRLPGLNQVRFALWQMLKTQQLETQRPPPWISTLMPTSLVNVAESLFKSKLVGILINKQKYIQIPVLRT
jgi:hypothetical protein